MIQLKTNSTFPKSLKSGFHHEYCFPTTHPCLLKVTLSNHFRGMQAIVLSLYAECWAIQRDQLATNTRSDGHLSIPAALTLLRLPFQSVLHMLSVLSPSPPQPTPLLKSRFIWPGRFSCHIGSLNAVPRTHTNTQCIQRCFLPQALLPTPGVPPEGLAVWIGVLETHLFQFTPPVQLVVPCVGLLTKVFHVHTDQHLPQLHKITVSFVLHCKKTLKVRNR